MVTLQWSCELATSARAACRGCKQKITKGEPRIGIQQLVENAEDMDERQRAMIEAIKWHHSTADCLSTFKKTAQWWMKNTPESIDNVPKECESDVEELLEYMRRGGPAAEKVSPKSKSAAKSPKGRPKSVAQKTRSPAQKRTKENQKKDAGDSSVSSSKSSSSEEESNSDETSAEDSSASSTSEENKPEAKDKTKKNKRVERRQAPAAKKKVRKA